jgi:hypothetical protein
MDHSIESILENQAHEDQTEYLEDISTLTPDYLASKFKTYLFDTDDNLPIGGNILPLINLLQAINEPSQGKRYIVSHKNKFVFKQNSKLIIYKNIDPIIFPIATHSTPLLTRHIKNIMDSSSHIMSETDLLILKNRIETFRTIIKILSSLNSRLYKIFKTKLDIPVKF